MKYILTQVDTDEITEFESKESCFKSLKNQIKQFYDREVYEDETWDEEHPVSFTKWLANITREKIAELESDYTEVSTMFYSKVKA